MEPDGQSPTAAAAVDPLEDVGDDANYGRSAEDLTALQLRQTLANQQAIIESLLEMCSNLKGEVERLNTAMESGGVETDNTPPQAVGDAAESRPVVGGASARSSTTPSPSVPLAGRRSTNLSDQHAAIVFLLSQQSDLKRRLAVREEECRLAKLDANRWKARALVSQAALGPAARKSVEQEIMQLNHDETLAAVMAKQSGPGQQRARGGRGGVGRRVKAEATAAGGTECSHDASEPWPTMSAEDILHIWSTAKAVHRTPGDRREVAPPTPRAAAAGRSASGPIERPAWSYPGRTEARRETAAASSARDQVPVAPLLPRGHLTSVPAYSGLRAGGAEHPAPKVAAKRPCRFIVP